MKRLINWVEIPVLDLERAMNFYKTVIGDIEFHRFSIPGAEYAIFPTEEPANAGALVFGEHYKPAEKGVNIYLDGGDDMQPMLDRASAAGASVLMPKTYAGKEAGYVGIFKDLEGNTIGIQHL